MRNTSFSQKNVGKLRNMCGGAEQDLKSWNGADKRWSSEKNLDPRNKRVEIQKRALKKTLTNGDKMCFS